MLKTSVLPVRISVGDKLDPNETYSAVKLENSTTAIDADSDCYSPCNKFVLFSDCRSTSECLSIRGENKPAFFKTFAFKYPGLPFVIPKLAFEPGSGLILMRSSPVEKAVSITSELSTSTPKHVSGNRFKYTSELLANQVSSEIEHTKPVVRDFRFDVPAKYRGRMSPIYLLLSKARVRVYDALNIDNRFDVPVKLRGREVLVSGALMRSPSFYQ